MIKNLLRSNIRKLTYDVNASFQPVLMEYGFQLSSIKKITKDVFEQLYLRGDDFILISTFDNYFGNVYNAASSKEDLDNERWCIQIRLGVGAVEYPEVDWSSISLKNIINYKNKLPLNLAQYNPDYFQFTRIIERTRIANKAKNDLQEYSMEFLNGRMEEFIEIRKSICQQRPVSKIIVENNKTGEKTESLNHEDLKFKERYS